MDQSDTILIIDHDPEERALLRDGLFYSDTFQVIEAQDGAGALSLLRRYPPHLVIVSWQLPDLAGRDLLIAFKSQGYRGPVIVTGADGGSRPIIEAFRLGATDYLSKPIREAEALAAVERALGEVRLRRHRDALMAQLKVTNRQLEARINELETLYNIGQTVTSMRDLERLFECVLEGALSVTWADYAVLLLHDEKTNQMVLRAGQNMPLAMLDRLGEPVRDQLADLVMTSRESLTVAGDGLRRFAAARDLYAVAYVPLIVQTTPMGVLAVGNRERQEVFDEDLVRLLRALADYAAIAIVNARLFSTLDKRARAMEKAYRELRERDVHRTHQLQAVLARFYQPLPPMDAELKRLILGDGGRIPQPVRERLLGLRQQVRQLAAMITSLTRR